VGTEQQLLARLAATIKRPRDLRAAERAVGERTAILAGERHALGNALIDDLRADRREPIDAGFPSAEVPPLHRLLKQPINTVGLVRIVLGGVNAPLRGDAVGPARRILNAESLDVVTLLSQRSGRRCARESRSNNNDLKLAPVAGRDQLHV